MGSLVRQAKRDPSIRLYVKRLNETLTERRSPSIGRGRDLRFFRARIESGPLGARIHGNSKEVKAIVAALISDFSSETDPARLKRYAWWLSEYRITGGKDKLIVLLKDCNEHERSAVLRALSHFKDDRLRSLALNGLKKERYPGKYLPLLNKNYRSGDADWLTGLIRKCGTPVEVHDLVDLIDVYRHNVVDECELPLLELYRRLNCGIHRYDLIKTMDRAGCLRPLLKNELRHDSYDEVREYLA